MNKLLKIAIASGLALSMSAANAALIHVGFDNGNDCSGNSPAFSTGNGFSNCAVNGSDVLIKFAADGTLDEISSSPLATSLDGSEFNFDLNGSVGWTYTPGTDDPVIRYAVGKYGNGAGILNIQLYYEVDDAFATANCGSIADQQSATCMDGALALSGGSFSGQSLSHMTFFNGGDGPPPPPPPPSVPEPGSLALLMLGLGALAVRRKLR